MVVIRIAQIVSLRLLRYPPRQVERIFRQTRLAGMFAGLLVDNLVLFLRYRKNLMRADEARKTEAEARGKYQVCGAQPSASLGRLLARTSRSQPPYIAPWDCLNYANKLEPSSKFASTRCGARCVITGSNSPPKKRSSSLFGPTPSCSPCATHHNATYVLAGLKALSWRDVAGVNSRMLG